ncbi:hypothetical protein AAG906_029234 [Vitis piasezkii]
MGDGSSSASSISKDEGPAKSLVLWREQDKGRLVVECKGDGYGMLCLEAGCLALLRNWKDMRKERARIVSLNLKDKHSRKGLQAMVQRRKKLLKYLRRTDWDSYCLVLSKLGLRDNPNYKN